MTVTVIVELPVRLATRAKQSRPVPFVQIVGIVHSRRPEPKERQNRARFQIFLNFL